MARPDAKSKARGHADKPAKRMSKRKRTDIEIEGLEKAIAELVRIASSRSK